MRIVALLAALVAVPGLASADDAVARGDALFDSVLVTDDPDAVPPDTSAPDTTTPDKPVLVDAPKPVVAKPAQAVDRELATRVMSSEDDKSPRVATAWAAGATAFGLAFLATGAKDSSPSLVIAGALFAGIGPSAGHLYAGDDGHTSRASMLRVASIILIALGDSTRSQNGKCLADGPCEKLTGRGNVMIALGAATYGAVAIYDIFDAHRAARRANEKRHARAVVAPTVVPTHAGMAPAIAFTGSF